MQTLGAGRPPEISLLCQQLLNVHGGLVHRRLRSVPRLVHPGDAAVVRHVCWSVARGPPHPHLIVFGSGVVSQVVKRRAFVQLEKLAASLTWCKSR
jgi:hypothetical protein